ncbi:phage tail protein [Mucilaginibacter gossypii]|uniref:phage tail protein n=1 Tax=Mucilaginibacter gossypii TaxID=551996 RepID=UPI000DCD250F|nr:MULTISPECIES: phage tail protein [Mucilaginibacter]QTE36032.1 phage tail protein [Mucilaginibacter gossypii]RAV56706.1 hypothetical protein DIU36_14995 [Mucilaginibacter rubeus]
MELVTVYKKGTSEIRAVINPDDKSVQDIGIMRNDIIKLSFAVTNPIFFAVGDYTTVFGRHYQLNREVPFKQVADRDIQYDLTFEGWQYDLLRANFLTLDANNHFTEGKFSFRGRAIDFMNLIIHNMERWNPGSGWTVGDVLDTDFITLDFDSENCLEALNKLADQCKTEYYFEGSGKRISLTKKAPASGVTLEYGQGKALMSIAKANQDTGTAPQLITRLYVYGGNRNIGQNYRDGAKYLRIGDVPYVDKNPDVFGVYEHTVYFDDVYPRREGSVTSIGDKFTFSDSTLEFNVMDYELPGVTIQVTFNTGQLAGSTFDVHAFVNDTKTFTINALTNETTNLPTDFIKPAVGDKYIIIGIKMPLSYITAAEAELKQRGIAYLNENGPGKVTFPVDANDLWFLREGIELQLGKTYRLLSTKFQIDRTIRLMSYTRNLRNPAIYTLELADSVAVQSTFVKLLNLIK